MKYTTLGRFDATCKRGYAAVVDNMLKEDQGTLRRNLEDLDDMEE